MPKKKPLPIGVSDYKELNEYYSVDKTEMIADVIDDKMKVYLFCRPRRFGKTLNMTMLRTFFEKTSEDTSHYFTDKKIWQMGEEYTAEQGKYPVIWLSFKDIKSKTFAAAMEAIYMLISNEFKRFSPIRETLDEMDSEYFDNIVFGNASQPKFEASLKMLSKFLKDYYGVPAIIMIDEYDTALQTAHTEKYYNDMIAFMRAFLGGAFKDNYNLKFGFLTGITRVAKESVFSGLNNLMVDTILDEQYSRYFGFTQSEINEMAKYYDAEDKIPEIKEWYDGYIFGKEEIYNPWSVINYFRNKCKPDCYWCNTSTNDILNELISLASENAVDELKALYEGETVEKIIEPHICYRDLAGDSDLMFSFLAISGYVKCVDAKLTQGKYCCNIKIPNNEIKYIYQDEILELTKTKYTLGLVSDMLVSLLRGNLDKFAELLKNFIMQTVSFYDASESFYHGLMLALCAVTTDFYKVSSNRESGLGRFDICLSPKKLNLPGYIFELKYCDENESLEEKAKEGLEQIEKKQYITNLTADGVTDIRKMSVAFRGKEAQAIGY